MCKRESLTRLSVSRWHQGSLPSFPSKIRRKSIPHLVTNEDTRNLLCRTVVIKKISIVIRKQYRQSTISTLILNGFKILQWFNIQRREYSSTMAHGMGRHFSLMSIASSVRPIRRTNQSCEIFWFLTYYFFHSPFFFKYCHVTVRITEEMESRKQLKWKKDLQAETFKGRATTTSGT